MTGEDAHGVTSRIGPQEGRDCKANRLRPGDYDGEGCRVCEEDGACREWAHNMAYEADVPLRWLVDMILDSYIDHDWSVEEVKELYSEVDIGRPRKQQVTVERSVNTLVTSTLKGLMPPFQALVGTSCHPG